MKAKPWSNGELLSGNRYKQMDPFYSLYSLTVFQLPSRMDTALAQLGAACLKHALENPQAQHNKDSPLFALFRSLSQGHIALASIEKPDDVTDRRPNASEISQLPATSWMTHVSKPDTKTYVARTLVNRNLTFIESDLFRNDQSPFFRDQYLRWRHICGEDDDRGSVLDRIVAAAKRLNMLKDEEIGSIPLEMTYFYLFSHYEQYKLSNNVASLTNGGLYDSILHRLYAAEWDHLSDRARLRHRDKLRRHLVIGRRWSLAVDRLSRGVILLAGKKISTLM